MTPVSSSRNNSSLDHASEKLSEDSTTDNCLTSQDYEESLCSASPPICVVREGVSSELGILAEENIRIEKEIDAVRDTVERADEKYKNALFLRSRAEFSRKKAEKTLHEREREVRDWATRVETAAAEQMGLVRACQKEGVASVLLQTVSRLDQEIVQMYCFPGLMLAR